MPTPPRLSYAAAVILAAIDAGYAYGLSIMESTGLPSGTVYPAVRRLEAAALVSSQWESERIATREQRPARKYYKITRAGRDLLRHAIERYPLLQKMDSRMDSAQKVEKP